MRYSILLKIDPAKLSYQVVEIFHQNGFWSGNFAGNTFGAKSAPCMEQHPNETGHPLPECWA